MADTKEKLSAQTRFLHWFIAIGMIMLVAVGIYMAETKTFALYPIHKSLGAIMLVFALWRLVVRLKNGFPQPLGKQSAALETLAKLVHWVLLLTTILFPLSGIMMSVMGGNGLQIFGLELIANNPNPDPSVGRNVPLNKEMAGFARGVHTSLPVLFFIALALHVAGAIKHTVVDKDGTMRRMMGK